MFNQLSERLTKVIQNITGRGRLTEDNISEALKEIRIALLDADVALPVVKALLEEIKVKALGKEVLSSLSPSQVFIKIVHDELCKIMGEENHTLNLRTEPPAIILMAGLQGSGKTTTAGKLALHLKDKLKKSVMMVSADIYRPAAIDQLATLAKQIEVECFPSQASDRPLSIVKAAIDAAKKKALDVVIVDTAGRLSIDQEMMAEIKEIHDEIKPIETLLVIDSMTGQDAVITAQTFHQTIPISGIILTKTDGDARGGAALSIKHTIGQPIKFLGVGEKLQALEPFYPDRLASRILGMGDTISLVEQIQENVDQEKAKKLAKKIQKGKAFDLEDFRDQLRELQKMGGINSILSKLPNMGALPPHLKNQFDEKRFKKIEALINSMTPKERRFPENIRPSQKARITKGSGTSVQDLNQLLKQFLMMQKMLKKAGKGGGMMNMMRNMKNMLPFGGGGFPGGFGG